MSSRNGFEITTSLRSDAMLAQIYVGQTPGIPEPELQKFYLLDLHRHRLLAAIDAFGWSQKASAAAFALQDHLQNYLKQEFASQEPLDPLKVRDLGLTR